MRLLKSTRIYALVRGEPPAAPFFDFTPRLLLLLHTSNPSKYFQQNRPLMTMTNPQPNPMKKQPKFRPCSPASLIEISSALAVKDRMVRKMLSRFIDMVRSAFVDWQFRTTDENERMAAGRPTNSCT